MGDAHPVAPGPFHHIVPPLDHERPVLRRAGPGLGARAPHRRRGRGPRSHLSQRGRRGLQLVPRDRSRAWEQQTRRWMARCDPVPALRLWLGHVGRVLPTRLPR